MAGCRAPAARRPPPFTSAPEALAGGPLAHVQDGDIIRLDPEAGVLTTVGIADLTARPAAARTPAIAQGSSWGYGRELFRRLPPRRPRPPNRGPPSCFALPSASNGHDDTPPNPNFVDRTVDA